MIIRVIKSHSFYLGLLVIICLAVYLSIYKIEEHLDILKKKTMNALKFVVLSCLTVFGPFKFHMAVRKHALVYISLCTLMATGGIFIYGGISGIPKILSMHEIWNGYNSKVRSRTRCQCFCSYS
jgi:cytochrome bd-type quinol oxidase subunit 2